MTREGADDYCPVHWKLHDELVVCPKVSYRPTVSSYALPLPCRGIILRPSYAVPLYHPTTFLCRAFVSSYALPMYAVSGTDMCDGVCVEQGAQVRSRYRRRATGVPICYAIAYDCIIMQPATMFLCACLSRWSWSLYWLVGASFCFVCTDQFCTVTGVWTDVAGRY